MIKERANIRTEFSQKRSDRKNLPVMGAIKFGMMNFTSNNVGQLNISRTARMLTGNGVKENLLPPGYQSLPEIAMLRYDQEQGEQLNKERVKVPKPGNI